MDTYEPNDHEQESFEPPLPPSPEIVAPLENLNPWISIIYRPRDTIRYVLDTGAWNNVWVLYGIIFILMFPSIGISIFAQPDTTSMQDLPSGLTMNLLVGVVLLAYAILGYPMGMLMLYFTAWLYRVVGSWLDGIANSEQMRISLTWTYVFSLYLNIVMLIPNATLAYYYQTVDELVPAVQIGLTLLQIGISIPMGICYFVITSKCVGEAHQFSAWRGLGTMIISFLIIMAITMVPIFILIGIIFAMAIL